MTPTDYARAMREAFPEPPGEVSVCRAIDRRLSDQRVFAELVELREPEHYWTASVIVHPRWNDVLERAL